MGFQPGITSRREDCYALERQPLLGEVIPGGNPTRMSYLYIHHALGHGIPGTFFYFSNIFIQLHVKKTRHSVQIILLYITNISMQSTDYNIVLLYIYYMELYLTFDQNKYPVVSYLWFCLL